VWSLLAAGPDSLWIGTYGAGLSLMVTGGGAAVFRHYAVVPGDPTKLQNSEVKALARDHRGGVWVGTTNGLYQMLGPLERPTFKLWEHDPTDPATVSGDYINSLYVDGAGTLWIGTLHGLDALDPGIGTIRHFPADPTDSLALSAPIITTILESLAYPGTMWIGTEDGGLHRLDPEVGVVAHYLVANGLPSNAISGLVEDEHGRLWLSTSQGLSRFDPTTETFTDYGATDGIGSLSFMVNASATATNGRIFFGAIEGLTSFVPDSVLSNPFVPPVVLTSLKVLNEDIDLEGPLQSLERIVLPHDQNFVSIEFAALDYSVPEKNQYFYRLFGVDLDWIESGRRRFASYPALSPGRYTFWVRGSNNDGVWNHTGATIAIVVLPPWWATWWFRVLATVIITVTVVQVFRARTGRMLRRSRQLESINASLSDQISRRRQAEEEREKLIPELEARNTELERFTYTVSHDLKSPLVTITGFLGLLEQDLANEDPKRVSRDVEQIRTAAGTMQQLLDELLDLSRAGRLVNPPTAVDLGELVEEALAVVEGQITARGATITVQEDLPIVQVDRVRMLQVLQNLIQNAIKFVDEETEPRIEVGSRQRASDYLVWVRDNGIGIDSAYWDRIFVLFNQLDPGKAGTGIGLALVKRIVEVHGGQVWLESEGLGKGSTFYFSLPMAIQRPDETGLRPSGATTSATKDS
jgi:signal transduction histidine kinase